MRKIILILALMISTICVAQLKEAAFKPLTVQDTLVFEISANKIYSEDRPSYKQSITFKAKSEDVKDLKIYIEPVFTNGQKWSKKPLYFLGKDKNGYAQANVTQLFLFEGCDKIKITIIGEGTIDDLQVRNDKVRPNTPSNVVYVVAVPWYY